MDALGNPLRFRLTGGQRHDITQAVGLVIELDFERLIADRSYDADDFLQILFKTGAEVVIPPRKNRNRVRDLTRAIPPVWSLLNHTFPTTKIG